MSWLILSLKVLARVAEGLRASQLQLSLYMLIPLFVRPDRLNAFLRRYYEDSYRNVGIRYPLDAYAWKLEDWEQDVIVRHMHRRATVLVLGAGLGRESMAVAQRGYPVLGIDQSLTALRLARQRAADQDVAVRFVQGDFFALPLLPDLVGYILLSGVMYSAVPSRPGRQQLLGTLRAHLAKDGKAVINFVIEREPGSPAYRFIEALTWLRPLGTNPGYEVGDRCAHGHFMHWFRREEEVRSELSAAGATILELNWTDAYAVIAWEGGERNTPGSP